MMNFLSQFGISGFWKAKKSTIFGLLLIVAGLVLDYASKSSNHTAALIAGLASGPFLAWKGKLIADGSVTMPTLMALLVGSMLLVAAPARAQDATPAPSTPLFQLCPFGKCFVPAGSFTGSIVDFAHMSAAKSFQVNALLKTSIATLKGQDFLGLAVGGGVQTGDITAVNATALVTLDFTVPKDSPVTPAVGATSAFIFQQKPSVSAIVGVIKPF